MEACSCKHESYRSQGCSPKEMLPSEWFKGLLCLNRIQSLGLIMKFFNSLLKLIMRKKRFSLENINLSKTFIPINFGRFSDYEKTIPVFFLGFTLYQQLKKHNREGPQTGVLKCDSWSYSKTTSSDARNSQQLFWVKNT